MNIRQRVYRAEMRKLFKLPYSDPGMLEQIQKCEEAYQKLSRRELRELDQREAFRPVWWL